MGLFMRPTSPMPFMTRAFIMAVMVGPPFSRTTEKEQEKGQRPSEGRSRRPGRE
jgi:hypothetical protein